MEFGVKNKAGFILCFYFPYQNIISAMTKLCQLEDTGQEVAALIRTTLSVHTDI